MRRKLQFVRFALPDNLKYLEGANALLSYLVLSCGRN